MALSQDDCPSGENRKIFFIQKLITSPNLEYKKLVKNAT
jgi:hypothetical protein